MLDNPDYGPNQAAGDRTPASGTSRRGFLKIAALAGAAVSFGGGVARANGEIGFWAKDLTDQQLIDMYTTILRIRWHERSMCISQAVNELRGGVNEEVRLAALDLHEWAGNVERGVWRRE